MQMLTPQETLANIWVFFALKEQFPPKIKGVKSHYLLELMLMESQVKLICPQNTSGGSQKNGVEEFS